MVLLAVASIEARSEWLGRRMAEPSAGVAGGELGGARGG